MVKDPNNQVAGYFLNGSYYEDTAVLYVASFANELFGNENTNPLTFQNTTQTFFNAGRAANKTKLVIDLSGNGGGNTILPNDLVNLYLLSIGNPQLIRISVPSSFPHHRVLRRW